jgi:GT2 family glycosyltransferase
MEKQTDLSIIIVSHNTRELLRNCLDSLMKNLKGIKYSVEIIVVDNASTDGSRQMLKDGFPKVTVVLNQENEGFGKANNQAIARAKGEHILLLNSDTMVIEDAVTRLLGFVRRHPKSFAGGKLFNVDGSVQSSCGPFFSLPVVFAVMFLKADRWGLTRYSPNRTRRVDWVSGACLMGARRNFLDGLTFDESIFMYMDEVDLLYRAREKGYRTYFFPNARFVHVGTGSSKGGKKQPVLNIYRGLLYFYKKHYSARHRLILKMLLKWKAAVAWLIGAFTANRYLRQTYAEAFKLV